MKRIRRIARRLSLPFRSEALVLLYHRIVDIPQDPLLLSVSPQHFDEHLQILCKTLKPLSLNALTRALLAGKAPRRSVAVTFDDGYADNLQNALPICAGHNMPGTVFISSGYLRGDQEFWWDKIEQITLHAPTLPRELHLDIQGEVLDWNADNLETEKFYRPDDHIRWNVLEQSDPSSRHQLYRLLLKRLAYLSWETRRHVLDRLNLWSGTDPSPRLSHRPLLDHELGLLEKSGLFEIGAHTLTHPVLAKLNRETQQNEIIRNKMQLEGLLHRPITAFSYPFGDRCDYTPETVQLVKTAGFACACTSFPGLIDYRTDPYQLPRFIVRDWDGDQFARRLRQWIHG